MKLSKRSASMLLMIGLLLGGTVAGALLAGQPSKAAAAPPAQTDACAEDDDSQEAAETEDLDDVEENVQCGSQDEDEAGEADEAAPANSGITAEKAQAIAEEANPGSATLAVEFDRDNGHDIFEVELDNGMDVKVDASSGTILNTEARD